MFGYYDDFNLRPPTAVTETSDSTVTLRLYGRETITAGIRSGLELALSDFFALGVDTYFAYQYDSFQAQNQFYHFDSISDPNKYVPSASNILRPAYSSFNTLVAGAQIKISSYIPITRTLILFMSGGFSLKRKIFLNEDSSYDPEMVFYDIDNDFSYTDFTFNLGLRWKLTQ